MIRFACIPAALVTLALAATGIAAAQHTTFDAAPAPAATPTFAVPIAGEEISGRISAMTGKYSLQLRDDRGFIDNVSLHPGTIINPTGLTLAAGMQVTITGVNAGPTFTANQIDAPYSVAVVPAPLVPAYYGFWGPAWGLGVGFGGFRGGYSWR